MTAQRRAFAVVNANVLRSPSISTSAKALYALLATWADAEGVCWPSNSVLAASLGCDVRTVHRLLGELQDRGVLIRTERQRENGSQTTCANVLLDLDMRRGGDTDVTPAPDTGVTPKKNRPQNKTTSLSSHGSDASKDEGFMAFYRLYPRHVARADAYKAWRQVTVNAKPPTDPSCIMAALTQQLPFLTYEATRDPEQNYCPLPATWLRAERWDDEITPRLMPLGRDDPFDPKRETRDQYLIRAGYV